MKKSKSTNPVLQRLVQELIENTYKQNAPIWRDLAERLSRSASKRAEVNLSRISRYTKENDIVVVPGKILSSGIIKHPVTVAAFKFSMRAKEKIMASGGRCISLKELMNEIPKGTNVRIME